MKGVAEFLKTIGLFAVSLFALVMGMSLLVLAFGLMMI